MHACDIWAICHTQFGVTPLWFSTLHFSLQLAAVYGQLGKREEQKKANQLVQQMKVDVKQEKMLSAKQSQKTFRRFKSSPRRRQTRTVSQFSIYQLPTLRQRSLTTLSKMAVWSSGMVL